MEKIIIGERQYGLRPQTDRGCLRLSTHTCDYVTAKCDEATKTPVIELGGYLASHYLPNTLFLTETVNIERMDFEFTGLVAAPFTPMKVNILFY